MNVEIWTEASQIPEKEYINGIFVAVRMALNVKGTWPDGNHANITSFLIRGED